MLLLTKDFEAKSVLMDEVVKMYTENKHWFISSENYINAKKRKENLKNEIVEKMPEIVSVLAEKENGENVSVLIKFLAKNRLK